MSAWQTLIIRSSVSFFPVHNEDKSQAIDSFQLHLSKGGWLSRRSIPGHFLSIIPGLCLGYPSVVSLFRLMP